MDASPNSEVLARGRVQRVHLPRRGSAGRVDDARPGRGVHEHQGRPGQGHEELRLRHGRLGGLAEPRVRRAEFAKLQPTQKWKARWANPTIRRFLILCFAL